MEIKQIATLIKENKLVFEYGEAKHNESDISISPEGGIYYKQPLKIFYNHPIGYIKIDDIFICQTVGYDLQLKNLKIRYGIFKDLEIEKKLPKANFKLLKIKVLLMEWQTDYSEFFGEQNLEKFLYLIEHIGVPKEYKQCKKPLYRGINLSDIALKKLEKGKSITLQARKFSSWSESKAQAIRFAGSEEIYSKGLLLQYSPTNEVLINVPLFYKEVFDSVSPNKLNKEREVILINSDKMLTMQPKQLVFTKKVVPSFNHYDTSEKMNREFLKVTLKSKATLKAMEEDLELFSIEKVKKLVSKLVVAAQKIYNNWDEKDIDTYAGGGICHLIADEFCTVFWKHKIPCSTVSSNFEQHVYSIIQTLDGVFTVDIHPSVYETGSGFSWKKIKNVKFDKSDIYFYKLSSNPEEFDEYLGE